MQEKQLRLDDLEYNNLKLWQDVDGYCFTSDAVLLANHVRATKRDIVVDFGCGNGVIAILVAGKTTAQKVVGVEKQEDAYLLAMKNVEFNNLQDRVQIVHADINDTDSILGKESVSVVVCNPPYFAEQSGQKRLTESIALARHESSCTLDGIVRQASQILQFGGKFFMIHKTERMAEVLASMVENQLSPKKMTLVYPKADKRPDTFIIEGKKGGQSGMVVDSLVVYNQDGSMTDQAKILYNKAYESK